MEMYIVNGMCFSFLITIKFSPPLSVLARDYIIDFFALKVLSKVIIVTTLSGNSLSKDTEKESL